MPLNLFFKIITAIAVLFSLIASPLQAGTAQAAGTGCMTGGPVSGAYTVTLCFTAPLDGAVLSGDQAVSISASTTGTSPGIARITFYLGGNYLLMDFQSPYTFTLPTARWVDGTRVLEVEAIMKDGFTSPRASVNVTFQNNVTTPPVNTNTFTIRPGTTPAPGQPFTLVASGDGAGGMNNYKNVTDLVGSMNPNMFLYLGDVYQKGTLTEFLNWYGTSGTFLGRYRDITNPIIGNHEYEKGVAPGYFDYWDNVPNYYSYDAAGWHFIALNSNCSLLKDCAVGQAQYNWLQNDLNAHPNACTIAYYHHPAFNVGPEGFTTAVNDLWALMAQHGVDIVLNGHDHNYQRWVPLDGSGQPSPNGIVEFVDGAGGQGTQTFVTTDSRMAVGFDSSPYAFGALRFQLNQQGASFQYINYQGIVLDSGAIPCTGAPADTTPPSAPANLAVSSNSSSQANLSWGDSLDNSGVAGYDVYRNGVKIASLGVVNAYQDDGLSLGATYSYQVQARDAAGNLSGFSNTATITMPVLLFSDNFESGTTAAWTTVTNLFVQAAEHYSGQYSVRATSPASAPKASNASKTLAATQTDLYYSLAFKIHSLGTTSAYLQRVRTATGGAIAGIYVSGSSGKLGYRNDISATSTTSTTVVTLNTWHQLQTHVQINGANSLVEVWYDGVKLSALSKTDSLGTTPIGRIQLGDSSSTNVYDISLDDAAANATFINTADTQAPTVPAGLAVTGSTPNSVTLAWSAASDNIAVTGYDLYRNNAFMTTVTGTDFVDTQAAPSFAYSYQVAARDAAGNVSALSAAALVTTPADTTPPAVALTDPPDGLAVSGNLHLAADASDNVGVEHVDFLVNNSVVSTQTESPYEFIWDTTTVPDGTLAVITARAVDSSGNAALSASRSVTVNNSGGDTQPPSAPGSFSAAAAGASRVDLSWTASTDNIGVTGYDIYRDGSLLASLSPTTAYSDSNVTSGASYQYQVQARDAAGNLSTLVSAAPVTVPAVLFKDGFESGGLSQWTNNGLDVHQLSALEGTFSAHAAGNGSAAAYASRSLGTPAPDLYYSTWFKLNSQGATSAYLQRFRTSTNGAILGVYISSTGKLGYRNDVVALSTTSTQPVSQGAWHLLQTHVKINATSSLVEVWLDGTQVPALSKTDSLGANPIGLVQLGDSTAANIYDALFDETAFDTSFVVPASLPYTSIDSAPAALNDLNSATFTFTSSSAGATFECSLDGALFASCASPQAYGAVADGAHTFAVRAIDALGQVDPTPAAYAWTIRTIPPAVTLTSPANGAVDLALGTAVSAVFSEPIDPASLTQANFSLLPQGGSTPVTAALSYDPATYRATLTPSAALNYQTTYTAALKGGPGGITDLAGNLLAADVTWSFTTVAPDTTPPSVSLSSPLDGAVLGGQVSLAADAADNVAVTSVDFLVNGTLLGSDTTAPYSFTWNSTTVPDGPAVLSARATDSSGNTADSAIINASVSNLPPDTTITSGPLAIISSNSASFSFTSTKSGSTFTCSLDGAAFSACSSPAAFSGLVDGPHTFQVRATDAAGVTDLTPASQTWTVDTIAPDTTITSGPSIFVANNSASFSFTSTESGSTFACSLDGAAFSACASPAALSGLANGSHTFQVRATDTAGNTDLTPASLTWTVDMAAPTGVAVTSPAAGATVTGTVKITASAVDNIGVVTVKFYVDGQLLQTSTTAPYFVNWNTKKFTKGAHSLYVIASDAAGNITQSAAITVTVN